MEPLFISFVFGYTNDPQRYYDNLVIPIEKRSDYPHSLDDIRELEQYALEVINTNSPVKAEWLTILYPCRLYK